VTPIEQELKRLAELEKAATKGPWEDTPEGIRCAYPSRRDPAWKDWIGLQNNDLPIVGQREKNAAFIAELRNAAPGLIEVAQIAVEALGNCMDADRCGCPHKCGNCVGLSQISKALLKGRE
jgi:hypothetical protein